MGDIENNNNMEIVGENTGTVNGTITLTNDNDANTSTVIAKPPVKKCKFRLIVSIQSYKFDKDIGRIPYSKLGYELDSIEYPFDNKENFGKEFGILLQDINKQPLQDINKQPSDTKIIINTIECMNVSNYPTKSIRWNIQSKTKKDLSRKKEENKFKEDFVFEFNENFVIIDRDITKLLNESKGFFRNSLSYLMNYRFLLDITDENPIILSSTYSGENYADLYSDMQMKYENPNDPTKNVYIRDKIISATLPPVSTPVSTSGGRKRKTKKTHKKRKTKKHHKKRKTTKK